MLPNKVFEIANRKTRISNYTFEQAMEALAAVDKRDKAEVDDKENSYNKHDWTELAVPTSCPPSTFKGGRPPHTRLKSWLASKKRSTSNKPIEPNKEAGDWPEDENPLLKKRRSLYEIINN